MMPIDEAKATEISRREIDGALRNRGIDVFIEKLKREHDLTTGRHKQLADLGSQQNIELPWLDVRNHASFESAVTAIGSTPATLYIPDDQPVAGSIATPTTLTIKFGPAGFLSIATGVTVTINGNVEAGLTKIFSCAGTGKVVFGAGAVKEIYPQWWGNNTTPGTTDMTAAINAAITAMPINETLVITSENYAVTTIVLKSYMKLLLGGTLTNITNIALENASQSPYTVSTHPTISIANKQNISIIGGAIVTPKYEGISIDGSSYIDIDGIKITGDRANLLAFDGIHAVSSSYLKFKNFDISNIGGIRDIHSAVVWGNALLICDCNHVSITDQSYLHAVAASGCYFIDCFDIKFLDNHINDVGINGIFLNKSAQTDEPIKFLFRGNLIEYVGADGIDCSQNGVAAGQSQLGKGIISDNILRDIGFLPDNTGNPDGCGLATLSRISDVKIEGNILTKSHKMAVAMGDAKNIIISNNKVSEAVEFFYVADIVDKLTVSENIVDVTNNFFSAIAGGTYSNLSIINNTALITGWSFYAAAPITNLKFRGNNIKNATPTDMGINVDGAEIIDNLFDGMIYGISGSNMKFMGNTFTETITFDGFIAGIVSNNQFKKGLNLDDTIDSAVSNNITNTSKGDYYFHIYGTSDKLMVLGNICYKNTAGKGLLSIATNSIFSNLSPDGTLDITGTGTIILD